MVNAWGILRGQNKMNEQFSILYLYDLNREPEDIPAFYQDLNLVRILDRISLKWGKNVRKFYRRFSVCSNEELYRRAIYCDIKKEPVYNALITFVEDLEAAHKLREEKEKATYPEQKQVWHIREIVSYCDAYEKLEKAFSEAKLESEGMTELHKIISEVLDSEYRKLHSEALEVFNEIRKLRFILTYDKDRISVSIGTVPGEGAYEEMMRSKSGRKIKHFNNPFVSETRLTEIEYQCIEIIMKKKPELFAKIKALSEDNSDYEKPVLARFEEELIFYLSYCDLQHDMQKEGYAFTTPERSEQGIMSAEGLYDLALAIANLGSDKEVISNDFKLDQGERFFVLTGPNQGGKTTFARSLGQLVFFTRMGLDVPAKSAKVPYFPDIQSHFSVEESVETGFGKLKEELSRLSPMMRDNERGSFVVINELFTTAASYDALIMGKRVLKHFIGLDCMGIYVTHLKELADEQEGVVSLRAMLDDKRMQTYEIKRGEAEDIPCAENLVNKHRLTYSQLKERL